MIITHLRALEKDLLVSALKELRELHLSDDDHHGMDCKTDHPRPMLEPNPAGCAACRIFERVL